MKCIAQLAVALVCVSWITPARDGLIAPGTQPSPAQDGTKAEDPPTPDELFAAWQSLDEESKRDTVEWFIAECDRATDFRSGLERYILDQVEGDQYANPKAQPTPFFDSSVHTPAEVIERHFVDHTEGALAKSFDRIRGGLIEHEFDRAFAYDWRRGEVVALGPAWNDPERVARNASRGFSPYTDLVEALVNRDLDQKSPDADDMRPYADAFGHAYADRDGQVFREITLYHAWASGAGLEMPDVEILGIIHTLTDDWKTYVAPIPERAHGKLYPRIAKYAKTYRRYRALRDALARSYVVSRPDLPRGYPMLRARLHGLWEWKSSVPADLAGELPSADDLDRWMKKAVEHVDRKPDVVARAKSRTAALKASEEWAQRTFHGILREYGAFSTSKEATVDEPKDDDKGGLCSADSGH